MRDLNPKLLEKKYRGRNFIEGVVVIKKVVTGIEGVELLGTDEIDKMMRELKRKRED